MVKSSQLSSLEILFLTGLQSKQLSWNIAFILKMYISIIEYRTVSVIGYGINGWKLSTSLFIMWIPTRIPFYSQCWCLNVLYPINIQGVICSILDTSQWHNNTSSYKSGISPLLGWSKILEIIATFFQKVIKWPTCSETWNKPIKYFSQLWPPSPFF